MIASLVDVTLGLTLVLLLRRPVRRLFGAGPAFTLWLLPLLLDMVPMLPMAPMPWRALPPVLVHGTTAVRSMVSLSAGPGDHLGDGLFVTWLVGCAIGTFWLTYAYTRLTRRCRPLPDALDDAIRGLVSPRDRCRLRLHEAGPAVLWAPRSLILLPADFLQRFAADQRAIVLAHEATHLRRGDAAWTLLAHLACTLLWFHPLVWLALPRFRLDQELACDESMLRRHAADEAAYARALAYSSGMDHTAMLIPWLSEPQLKERLMMIRRQRVGTMRRRLGYPLLALLAAACAVTVQAGDSPPVSGATQDLAYNARMQPAYPPASIQQKEQGTVILDILVSPQGTVEAVNYNPKTSSTTSAGLIGAASDAAFHWHFQPAKRNGKPIESYARVPVKFSLSELPGPGTEKSASESPKNL